MHSTRDFGRMRLWQLPLDGSPPTLMQPPGFTGGAHATRSKNGIVASMARRTRAVFEL